MKLATRCPACGTVFRVVPDQLKISDGWVRCGYCFEVFDARAHFVDPDALQREARPAAAALPQATAPGTPAAPETAAPTRFVAPAARTRPRERQPRSAQAPDTDLAAAPAPGAVAGRPPDPAGSIPRAGPPAVGKLSAPALAPATAPFPAAVAGSRPARHAADIPPPRPPDDAAPSSSTGSASEKPATSGPAAPTVPEPAFATGPADTDPASTPQQPREPDPVRLDALTQDASASAGEPALLETRSAEAPPATAARTPPATTREDLPRAAVADMTPQNARDDDSTDGPARPANRGRPEAAPAFVRRAERRAFWRRPAVRLGGGFVLLLLAASLALQLVRIGHDVIAARFARLRTPLAAICRPLGCTIADLRRIDDIAIDNAAFERLSSNTYGLAFTLRNRGPLPIALPWVELALSDIDGRTLVRRVLSPAELGVKPAALAAGEERNARMRFTVEMTGIAGYRVLAFYP